MATSRGTALPFRVRVDVNSTFDPALLQKLGDYAASRGVYKVNIVNAVGPLKYVRVTCQSMTIPIEVLDYVLSHHLPFERSLEQPEFLPPGVEERILGDGIVIALKGVEIQPGVIFRTQTGNPIILGENVTVRSETEVPPGTVLIANPV